MCISDTIRRFLGIYADKYGLDAYNINCGSCENFARDVIAALAGEAENLGAFWHDEMSDCTEIEAVTFAHRFIRYCGRYYDSQAPNGVDHWRQLPYFVASAACA